MQHEIFPKVIALLNIWLLQTASVGRTLLFSLNLSIFDRPAFDPRSMGSSRTVKSVRELINVVKGFLLTMKNR